MWSNLIKTETFLRQTAIKGPEGVCLRKFPVTVSTKLACQLPVIVLNQRK